MQAPYRIPCTTGCTPHEVSQVDPSPLPPDPISPCAYSPSSAQHYTCRGLRQAHDRVADCRIPPPWLLLAARVCAPTFAALVQAAAMCFNPIEIVLQLIPDEDHGTPPGLGSQGNTKPRCRAGLMHHRHGEHREPWGGVRQRDVA